MRTRLTALLLLCVSLFAATNLLALPANGSLHGTVTDPSGARVVKATITVQAADGTTSTVQSGADGTYLFPNWFPVLTSSPWPPRALISRSLSK